ncbi:MAG: hypothetical protein K2J96_02525 [Bacteroidaceae bacterium]|nr:hypothetical protein [Bacteroidaceae bacterium]
MKMDVNWSNHYDKIMHFMEENKRRPSKYKVDERPMANWIKHHKKLFRYGLMPEDRQERFKKLMVFLTQFQRINQHAYVSSKLSEKARNGKNTQTYLDL